MDNFYDEFTPVSKEKWLDIVNGQLKGKDANEFLTHFDSIEEIEFSSISFPNKNESNTIAPGSGDLSRGNKTQNNDWINNITVSGEDATENNKLLLHYLMNGATGIKLDFRDWKVDEIEKLCKNISFKDIHSTIFYSTKEQFDWLQNLAEENEFVGTAINTSQEDFGLLKNTRNRLVKAIDVQYVGGNVSQEIAYALHQGHEVLFQLIKKGLNIDEAAKQIKFQFGIGGNYFFEIVKFKVFRSLWSLVVSAYQPKDEETKKAYLEAETGFLNKSLKDPHTNLLRQTTEALSAIIGGIEELTIQAYNSWSKNEDDKKPQRLALNIALLLKEESYFDKVIDPIGGAYEVEKLYSKIREKSWELFRKCEKEGIDFLQNEIQRIKDKRIELIVNKENILIGINDFLNPEIVENSWEVSTSTPFGSPLILEIESKVEA